MLVHQDRDIAAYLFLPAPPPPRPSVTTAIGVFRASNREIVFVELTISFLGARIVEITIAALEAAQGGAVFQTARAFRLRRQIQRFFQPVNLAFDHVNSDRPNGAGFVKPNFKGFRFRIRHDGHRIRITLRRYAAARRNGAARWGTTSGHGTFSAGNDATTGRRWDSGRGDGSGGLSFR